MQLNHNPIATYVLRFKIHCGHVLFGYGFFMAVDIKWHEEKYCILLVSLEHARNKVEMINKYC